MKRIIRRGIGVFILSFTCLTTIGQDIHFSQFNASPLTLNPALTGVIGGDYRVVANYRSQWQKLAAFSTLSASYDMSLFKDKPKSNFGGVGLMLFSDGAGDLSLRTTQVNLSMSYTVLLNENGRQTLTSAIYGGFGHRSIDYSNIITDSQIGPTGFDPGADPGETFDNDKLMFADLGAGFLWNYVRSDKVNYYAGASVWHLNQPNLSFLDDPTDKLYLKFAAHAGGYFGLTEQIFLLPSFMFLNQGPQRQFNVGSMVKFKKSIFPTDRTAFYFGVYARFVSPVFDALSVSTRVDIGSFNIGFSYDINISGLTPATNLNGGPEVSLIYTGIFPNKANQVKYCPAM